MSTLSRSSRPSSVKGRTLLYFIILVSIILLLQLKIPYDCALQRPIFHHRLASTYRQANTCPQARSRQAAKASSEPKLDLSIQRTFANGGYNQIARGSGDVNAVGMIINVLSKLQHASGLYGTLAELGVHHGRFTGFLFITARQTEKLVVGDLFEQQDKNVDKSGLGDRRRFLEGLSTYGLSESHLHRIFTGSTDELPFDWSSRDDFEPFRLISVDASHTAELTFNDLQLSFCNLLIGGIVILDDWFHSTWPGVVEGYYRFVDQGPVDEVFPFLICESKLFVTNSQAAHERYYHALLEDPDLSPLLSPYAHEKERGKLLYEMNGVHYLKCQPRQEMTIADIQRVWVQRVY